MAVAKLQTKVYAKALMACGMHAVATTDLISEIPQHPVISHRMLFYCVYKAWTHFTNL